MPMLSWPPVTISLTLSALGRISVNGPGQNLFASFYDRDGKVEEVWKELSVPTDPVVGILEGLAR